MSDKNFKVKHGLDVTDTINIGSGTSNVSIDASSKTDAFALPTGTSGQRPTATNGMLRFNTTNTAVEAYFSSSWNALATLDYVNEVKTNITVSTSDPSGGSDGDLWLKVDS